MRAILVRYCGQLETDAVPRDGMADRGFGANLAFLHQKIKLDGQARRAPLQGLEEQTGYTEVANPREIVASVTMPVNPDGLMRVCAYAGIEASGGDSCSLQHRSCASRPTGGPNTLTTMGWFNGCQLRSMASRLIDFLNT
jgi:hypothetical protein